MGISHQYGRDGRAAFKDRADTDLYRMFESSRLGQAAAKENAVKDTESATSSLPDEQEEEELYSAVPSQATVTKSGRIIKRPEYYGNPRLYLIS